MHTWSLKNKLHLNASKTAVVTYHRSNPKLTTSYHLNGSPLAKQDQHIDLGVTFDRQLRFHPQTDLIAKRTMQLTGAINRHVVDIGCKSLAFQLYKSFVLPIAEYCSPIWNQNYVTYNEKTEISLHAISRITLRSPYSPLHPNYLPYIERLNRLDLQTLHQRRVINMKEGSLVILKNDNTPPATWPLARGTILLKMYFAKGTTKP